MAVIAFNKPYGVLCQFTSAESRPTLADYISMPGVYPAGRLDQDSEGLLLLTDDGNLQASISDPVHKTWKLYLAQVERQPELPALRQLCSGIDLADGRSLPAKARLVTEPEWLWPRNPPIRYRKNVADAWVELEIREGRNRQIRRMTAAVGHPTLRLIRVAIGPIKLDGLAPGAYRRLDGEELAALTKLKPRSVSGSPQSRRHRHRDSGRAGN